MAERQRNEQFFEDDEIERARHGLDRINWDRVRLMHVRTPGDREWTFEPRITLVYPMDIRVLLGRDEPDEREGDACPEADQ